MHVTTDPPILYFGTPVVLISTENDDATANLAPMSSAWWLGHRCVLGLAAGSRTTQNLQRTGECVLNLPSASLVGNVDRIARTTGSDPVPDGKRRRGYRHVAEKFTEARLTPVVSELVSPPRVAECPVQMEATLEAAHPVGEGGLSPSRWPSYASTPMRTSWPGLTGLTPTPGGP
jgi:flavin reductase (DIM6/NTAB) family NADH-FMN oxidoreductase RutF